MSEFTFSSPSLDDVSELAKTHVRCWRETYAESLPAEILDVYTEENRDRMWTKVITSTPDQVLLVRNYERLIGFASWKREKKLQTEISTLYVLKEFQGRGIGKKLVQLISDLLPKDEVLGAWVLVGNPSSAFYIKMGFVSGETAKKPLLTQEVIETYFSKAIKAP